MSFWSTQTLNDRLLGVVKPFDPTKIKQACYRLSMGNEYYISPHANDIDSHYSRQSFGELKSVAIPPGQFGFLLTHEIIDMPDDALGFISMQTDLKFMGLVNVSGFHVDPGSRGKILFSVFNAGPNPVHIAKGDEIFRLWIAGLDKPDNAPRKGPGYMNIPTAHINKISGSLESLQSLSKQIIDINNKVSSTEKLTYWCFALCVAIVGTLVVSAITHLITDPNVNACCVERSAPKAPKPSIQ